RALVTLACSAPACGQGRAARGRANQESVMRNMWRFRTSHIIALVAGLVVLTCLAPSGEGQQVLQRAGPRGNPQDKSRTHEQVDADDHGVSEIALERTRCFGTCPAYSVVIKADGTFTYTGKDFVTRKGEHAGTVSQHDLRNLSQF